MQKIIDHIKQADKRRLFIYLFSYATYRLLNNAFSNTTLYILGEGSFRERWTSHSIPCGDTPHLFLILFELFKILLFIVFVKLAKQNAKGLWCEFFIAYFLYDLVYILSFVWDRIPFPVYLHSHAMLISSGQIFLCNYLRYLDLVFACLWTLALFLVLYRDGRLSIQFLVNRLAIIPISVPLISWTLYFIRKLFWGIE